MTIFGHEIDWQDSRGWERGWITPKRALPPGWGKGTVRAKFTAHYIAGNSAPYISVTCDTFDERGRDDGGGAAHDLIGEAFPELLPLIPLHLTSTEGVPTHFIENACYWAELALGVSRWQSDAKQDPRGTLKRHALLQLLDDGEAILDRILAPIDVEAPAGVVFEQYAQSTEGKAEARRVLRNRIASELGATTARLRAITRERLAEFRIVPRELLPATDGATAQVARDFSTRIGGGRIKYLVHVRGSTRVRFFMDPSGGRWLVDDLGGVRFAEGGDIARHDAEHYGIPVDRYNVC